MIPMVSGLGLAMAMAMRMFQPVWLQGPRPSCNVAVGTIFILIGCGIGARSIHRFIYLGASISVIAIYLAIAAIFICEGLYILP